MKKVLIAVAAVITAMAVSFGLYVSDYYRADETVKAFLVPDEKVRVEETVRLVMEAIGLRKAGADGN